MCPHLPPLNITRLGPKELDPGPQHDLSPMPLTVSEPPAPAFSRPWWYVLLGAVVAAACVFILTVFLVHRRRKETRYG